jgi:hypothetical protein
MAAALHDLLAEAARLDDGYLTVAEVLPGRREAQLVSMPAGAADASLAQVEDATASLPAGTRVRVRLWKRGGHPVRGVVVTRTSGCPACAELRAILDDQNARVESLFDERDDLQERVGGLTTRLADAKERNKALRQELREKHRQWVLAMREAARRQERAAEGEALAAMVNAMELP